MQPRLYIPFQENWQLPGPIYRLGDARAGRLRIEADSEHGEYTAAKRNVAGIWDSSENQNRMEPGLLDWLQGVIRRDQPNLVRPGATNLDSIISGLQEDVVFMCRPGPRSAAAQAKALYMHVSFPSGWCPNCMIGRSFLRIHASVPAVADFGPLERKDAARALFEHGESVRFVWSLSPDNSLDRRKCRRRPEEERHRHIVERTWASASAAWLRIERQVISPIDRNTACFFIRVYRYRVSQFESAVRERIRQSLRCMSMAIRKYKGLDADLDRILSLT